MIVNLTQHAASAEQLAAGVTDLEPEMRAELAQLLTFTRLPSGDDIEERALAIVQLCLHLAPQQAMIGGAPYLMGELERCLIEIGIEPLYAYSERVSEEQTQPDGTVRKVQVFRHLGFVSARKPVEYSGELAALVERSRLSRTQICSRLGIGKRCLELYLTGQQPVRGSIMLAMRLLAAAAE